MEHPFAPFFYLVYLFWASIGMLLGNFPSAWSTAWSCFVAAVVVAGIRSRRRGTWYLPRPEGDAFGFFDRIGWSRRRLALLVGVFAVAAIGHLVVSVIPRHGLWDAMTWALALHYVAFGLMGVALAPLMMRMKGTVTAFAATVVVMLATLWLPVLVTWAWVWPDAAVLVHSLVYVVLVGLLLAYSRVRWWSSVIPAE